MIIGHYVENEKIFWALWNFEIKKELNLFGRHIDIFTQASKFKIKQPEVNLVGPEIIRYYQTVVNKLNINSPKSLLKNISWWMIAISMLKT